MPFIIPGGGAGKETGMVRLNQGDSIGYLSTKIDDSTLKIDDDKIIAKRLQGLSVNVTELNYLENAEGNIQNQIDLLTSVTNFAGAVKNHSDIQNIENSENKDMIIVIEDETKAGKTTIYIYGETKWEFIGKFEVKVPENTDGLPEGELNLYYTENKVSDNIDVKNNTLARHTHSNKETIDKLSENVDGKLLFDGNLIEGIGGDGTIDWKEF